MKLEKRNRGGRYSMFTYYPHNAYKDAHLTRGGTPVGPEVHGGGVAAGFMYHYHTAKHTTPAHAFFEEKLRS